jgi:hypothetical protein
MYEDDLRIDRYDLHNEWEQQPFLFMKYAQMAAEADTASKRAKEKMEVTEAELYLTLRKEKELSKEKFTEASLKAEIKVQDEYQKVFIHYTTVVETQKILSAAVEAFMQRKSALENMVKLYLNNYFAHPSEPKKNSVQESLKERLGNKNETTKKRRKK